MFGRKRLMTTVLMTVSALMLSSCSFSSGRQTAQSNKKKDTAKTQETSDPYLKLSASSLVINKGEDTEIKFVIETNIKGDYSLYSDCISHGIPAATDDNAASQFMAETKVGHFDEGTDTDAVLERQTVPDTPDTKSLSDEDRDVGIYYNYAGEELYYTATVKINMPTAGDVVFFAGNPSINDSITLRVCDPEEAGEIKNKYIERFNKIYIKNYGNYITKIAENMESGNTDSPDWSGEAYSAARAAVDAIEKEIPKLIKNGAVINRTVSMSSYTILWADGDTSGWDLNLDKIGAGFETDTPD